MKNILIILSVSVSFLLLLSPAFAEDASQLQRVIELQQKQLEQQQRQIDAQQQQLQEQRNMHLDMQQKVRGLAEGVAPAQPPDAKKVAAKPSETTPPRRTDTQTARRDKAHPHEEWEGYENILKLIVKDGYIYKNTL